MPWPLISILSLGIPVKSLAMRKIVSGEPMAELPGSLKRVVELFEREKRVMTVDEVAAALSIKPTTAKKYLDQLVRLGILAKDGPNYWLAKPVEERKPEIEKAEAPKVEERKPAVEVKAEAVAKEKPRITVAPPELAFYFYKGGAPVVLAIRSVEQLWAALRYGFVDEEALSYAVKSGLLSAWIANVLNMPELAEEIAKLREVEPSKIVENVRATIEKFFLPS